MNSSELIHSYVFCGKILNIISVYSNIVMKLWQHCAPIVRCMLWYLVCRQAEADVSMIVSLSSTVVILMKNVYLEEVL
jgi:hypothetical protein